MIFPVLAEPEMCCAVPAPMVPVRMPAGLVFSDLVAWMHRLIAEKRARHARWKGTRRKGYKAAKRRANRKARGEAPARGLALDLKRERKAATMRRYRAKLRAEKDAMRAQAGEATKAVARRKAEADERRRRKVEREERAKGIY